jgi:hypothetical protein
LVVEPPTAGAPATATRSEEAEQPSPSSAAPSVAEPSLRHELRERVISLPTMHPMLRGCALLAIGLLVLGLVLGLLKDVHLPDTRLSIAGANPIVISLPALVLILMCFGLAWCYAICGALYGPLLLRVVVLAVFAYAMLSQGSAFWTSVWSGRGRALLGALVVLAIAVAAHGMETRASGRRPLESTRERVLAAVVFVLVAAVEVIAWWASRGAALPGVFAISFFFQLTVFAVLAYLFMSGSGADFAQAAGVIAGAARAKIGARRTLLTVAALALALGLLVRAAVRSSWSLPGQILLAVAAAGVIGAIATRHRDALRRGRLPSWSPLAAGVVVQAAVTAGVLIVALGAKTTSQVNWKLPPPTNVYQHASAPRFSIAVPPGWSSSRVGHTINFLGTPTGVPAFAQVWDSQLTRPLSGPITPTARRALLHAFELARFGSTAALSPTSDPRQFRLAISPPGQQALLGLATGSVESTHVWVVQVLAPAWIWRYFSPVASAMVGSWRPDLGAEPVVLASPAGGTDAQGQIGMIALGLSILLAMMLAAFRVAPWVAFTGLLLLGSMLVTALTELRQLVALAAGDGVSGVPHLSFGGIEAAVAIAIIGLALSTHWKPLSRLERWTAALSPLLVLALVVLLLDLLFDVYAGASSARTLLTVAGVTFLLAGFLWDVMLSGDVTNSDGHRMRRPARVLVYLAYMLAASAAVLYFGSAHELGPWTGHDYFLEPDLETALSIGLVGVAYAVVVCIGRLASLPPPDRPGLTDQSSGAANAIGPATQAPRTEASEPAPIVST